MTENNKKRVSIEVEPDFHRELKLFATLRGMTLQNYITTVKRNTGCILFTGRVQAADVICI